MRVSTRLLTAPLLFLALLAATPDAPRVLPPVDEATRDDGLVAFRDELREAVARRDGEAVRAALTGRVYGSFGGSLSIDEFAEQWEMAEPDGRLWSELAVILDNGGVFETSAEGRDTFCAPYVSYRWPALDPYEGYGVILGEAIPLRAAPKGDAKVLATLTYDIVRAPARAAEAGKGSPPVRTPWLQVETAEGQEGYVETVAFRSPLDNRACFFQRGDGEWKMLSLVAGD